ncbi:DRAP deaminase [Microthyrium microscopicum]|uniref:Pseudouridine synthase n=1 Tax=Microthyrium microscopicum TaxID=703497 RepID=A0A6A6U7E4_9PEZI|nr:DRAP deaminase [Microthyrium microscopicum]
MEVQPARPVAKIFPQSVVSENSEEQKELAVKKARSIARSKGEIPDDDEVLVTPVNDPWPRPYYLEHGLRRVRPYFFTYNTYCKGRWRDRPLLEIFASEFRDRSIDYYKSAIESGNITINGKQVAPKDLVRNGDVVTHTIHRHEPPVTPKAIGIVHEDEDLMIIDKPAGVPVHPAGRYNFNSLIEILRAQRGYQFNPLPCHRLDRLTSGIMFIGKHGKAAEKMGNQLKDRTIKKEYVARVVGEFPEGDIICEKPVLQISPKLGLNAVRANGKEARTVFKRLAYYPPKEDQKEVSNTNGATSDDPESLLQHADGTPWKRFKGYSIVRCMPLTGRTHQIRVHLQFLGHPIANDPIYSNQRVFGPALGRGTEDSQDDETIMQRLERMGKDEVADAVAYHDEMVDKYHERRAEKMTGETCDLCDTPLYSDPGPHELGIYLHAKRYACDEDSWSYETQLPDWALPPDGYDGPVECTPDTDPMAVDLAKLSLEKSEEVAEPVAPKA